MNRRAGGRSVGAEAQAKVHERARELASLRLTEPLRAADATWLDAHLADCADCRAIADAYAADRAILRAAATPVPPRDLWARTAARLDGERPARRFGSRRRLDAVPLGALAGVLVVAVVLGASFLDGRGPVRPVGPSADASGPSPLTAAVSPLAVDQEVGVARPAADGTLGIMTANVDEVCGTPSVGACRADTSSAAPIALNQKAKSVVRSPNGKQIAVVVGAQGGGVVIVAAPSAAGSSPGGSPGASPSVLATPGTPTASPSSASPSSSGPSSSGSPAAPSASPSSAASASPSSAASASPSPSPSAAPSTATPSGSPSASVGPTASPLFSVAPSASALPISIADDLVVNAQSASYSPSGTWLAFSARPGDGSQGPDIWVWRVGDAKAHPVTSDHRSVFSTWVGENILGSRAEPITTSFGSASPAPALDSVTGLPSPVESPASSRIEARSVSFVLDPATGASRTVTGDGIWRPVLAPSGRFAVYWSGTIEIDANGLDWRPANGTLVLARWDPSQLVTPPSPAVEASADPSPTPSSTTDPSPSPGGPVALLASPPIADWGAQWDATGSYLGIWIADRPGSDFGRLSLHSVDPGSGTLDPAGAVFTDETAAAGFAIGHGRVAWVAPDGASASIVKVYAWTGAKGGAAETTSQPEDTLVIR